MSSEFSSLQEFNYDLPEKHIAKHPLQNRDASKLLVYKNGEIRHHQFTKVLDHIPNDATLFLNDTKVIAARLYFFKKTGAKIEVFLTDPVLPYTEFQQALKVQKSCVWKCIIGNLKKWKDGEKLSLTINDLVLNVELIDRANGHVEFSWSGDFEFLDIIEAAGKVPLPPYLNREEEPEDKVRYQTVFSENEGAVAAPTAGLHFTEELIEKLIENGITKDTVTLHVSAGTFRPIKAENFTDHDMHNEKIIVHRRNIENILASNAPIIAVGTTALRTLESVYWYGVKLIENEGTSFFVRKEDPYNLPSSIPMRESLEAVLRKFNESGTEELHGETEIFIYPGYEFKIVNGLFTNFHMPSSTLILLVAAFVGEDWRKIYDEALSNNYRFLSYGDTSLLLR